MNRQKALRLLDRFRLATTPEEERNYFFTMRNLGYLDCFEREDWDRARDLFPGQGIGNPHAPAGTIDWCEV
jgi:hypothetical protein